MTADRTSGGSPAAREPPSNAPLPGSAAPATDVDGADSIARNAVFSFAAQMITAALTAVLTVFLVRELGPTEYGLFALATSISVIVLIAADFGISASSARFTAEHRGDRDEVAHLYVNSLKLKVLATGGVCLLLAVLAGPISQIYENPGLEWPLRAIAVATFGQSLFLMGGSFFTALGKIVVRLRTTAAEAVMEVGASIVLVLLGAGAAGAAFGRAIGYLCGALLSITLALRLLGRPSLRPLHPPDRGTIRRVGRYASALLAVDASYVMSSSANVLFLGAYLGSAASGMFQGPARLITLLQYPGMSVANGVAPRLARAPGREPDVEALRNGLRGLVGFQCLLLAPAVVWPAPIVDLILGSQYADSAGVLRALAPYLFFTGLAPLLTQAINYVGEARRRIPIAVSTLGLTIIGGVTLIPEHGLVGAAISTDVAYGFYSLAHLWLCRRVLGLSLTPIASSLARGLLAAGAMALVLVLVGTTGLTMRDWVVGGVAGVAVYLGVLICTGEVRPRDMVRLLRRGWSQRPRRARRTPRGGRQREGRDQASATAIYEIRWRATGDAGAFELQPLDGDAPSHDGAEATSPAVAWGWRVPPAPVPEAVHAHQQLTERLVEQGWAPCGRGDAWFAERFRRD